MFDVWFVTIADAIIGGREDSNISGPLMLHLGATRSLSSVGVLILNSLLRLFFFAIINHYFFFIICMKLRSDQSLKFLYAAFAILALQRSIVSIIECSAVNSGGLNAQLAK